MWSRCPPGGGGIACFAELTPPLLQGAFHGQWVRDVAAQQGGSTTKRRSLPLFSGAASFAGICVLLSASVGCSGQSSFLTGGPTVGQLKTSLSHLEYENEQLKKRTAKLEQESRSIENRLVQEQIDNGDLTGRLDDARNLLRDRGVDDIKLGSRRRSDGNDESVADDRTPARTLPAGRSTRPRRKAPFAQISSGPGNAPAPADDGGDSATGSRKAGMPRRIDRPAH